MVSDQSMRHTDELLTELTEIVETARALPMSASIVLPRERVLDILDEIRDHMPLEIEQARKVLASRDTMLHTAHTEATEARQKATEQADALVGDATARAADLVKQAEVRVFDLLEDGKREHAELVSATSVHKAAVARAAELAAEADDFLTHAREEADRYSARVTAEADEYAAQTRGQADAYAGKLTADADDYADHTLAELADTLRRSMAVAEQGRSALARRRRPASGAGPAAVGAEHDTEHDTVELQRADRADLGISA